jgi:hypothetical protein
MRYVEIACRLCLLTVFAVALAGKVSGKDAFAAFVRSLRAMGVVPEPAVAIAARASVVAEALVVVLLAVPARYPAAAGFAVAAGLLAAFAAAIQLSVRRGNSVPCRCFGVSSTPLGTRHVVRNVVLIAVALAGLTAALSPGQASMAGLLVAGAAGVVVGATVTAFDDIVALVRPTANPRGR